MAKTSSGDVVEVTDQDHAVGDLSNSSLQTAEICFDLRGIVAWRHLWQRNEDVERQTLDILRGLPTEKNFIYVRTRSQLPLDIVYNKVSRSLGKCMYGLCTDVRIVCYEIFGVTFSYSKASSNLR
jgi:hypothetical protein